jgi:hypothetical protein
MLFLKNVASWICRRVVLVGTDEDGILHSHHPENLKSYTTLTG